MMFIQIKMQGMAGGGGMPGFPGGLPGGMPGIGGAQ
jgi:hypothetical protein